MKALAAAAALALAGPCEASQPASIGAWVAGDMSDGTGDGMGDGETGEDMSDGGEVRLDLAPLLDIEQGGEDPTACVAGLDLVFVVDVAGPVAPFFDVLGQSLAQLDGLGDVRFGLVVFADDLATGNGGEAYAGTGALASDLEQWRAFAGLGLQPASGEADETLTQNSLDALAMAAGFDWRPASEAIAVVVHATSESFWDGPTRVGGLPIVNSYSQTAALLVSSGARVLSWAPLLAGESGVDDASMGFFTDYQGQPPIPAQTGGSVHRISEPALVVEAVRAAIAGLVCEGSS